MRPQRSDNVISQRQPRALVRVVLWRAKDAAMYLVTALAVTNSTQARGASTTNPFVDVIDFYGQHVLPELQSGAAAAAAAAESDVGANIVRADALRFSSLFRQMLPVESYATLLPLFVELLRSSDNVVHSYAAACVANFLTVKDRPPAVARPTARVTAPPRRWYWCTTAQRDRDCSVPDTTRHRTDAARNEAHDLPSF
jgi:hypothetical protein